MTTPSAGDDAVAAAWAELQETLAQARATLDQVRAEAATTPEERRELQRMAASGELGRDMQTLARHVEAGDTSWAEVFEGASSYSDLLRGHLDRMGLLHGERVRLALEADPDFDPARAHDET